MIIGIYLYIYKYLNAVMKNMFVFTISFFAAFTVIIFGLFKGFLPCSIPCSLHFTTVPTIPTCYKLTCTCKTTKKKSKEKLKKENGVVIA